MIKKGRKAKKFLSLLLSVAMALTIFAGVGQMEVKADEIDSGAEVTHTDHVGWIDLNGITHIAQYSDIPQGKNYEYQGRYYIVEGGNYYLSSDIVSTNIYGAIQIGDRSNSCEVTICLDGHEISAGISSGWGVVRVMPKCQLTVVDCSTDKSGKIVESTNKDAAINTEGNLKVNGVKELSGSYGIKAYIGQSVPDDSDTSAVSIEINDANITGTESSVYTSE